MATPTEPTPVTPSETVPVSTPVETPTPETPKPVETPPAGNPNMDSLVTAIGALPEKIVDSLREAMQPSTPTPAPQTAQPANPVATAASAHVEPGRKSFTDWWFGK